MEVLQDAIDHAISDLDRLRKSFKRGTNRQVRSLEEKSHAKAFALAWFNNYRKQIIQLHNNESINSIDEVYTEILEASDIASSRSWYDEKLKQLRKDLSKLRREVISSTALTKHKIADLPPDFSKLIHDPKMREILSNRWNECIKCIYGDAPLAATVMMGGLLEALLLARINLEDDQSKIFTAKTSPKDSKTKKTKKLKDWTLMNFIDVVHELEWITQSTKDIGEVLRDYRNYVHPYKEFSHNVKLELDDAKLFWDITKNITNQLINRI